MYNLNISPRARNHCCHANATIREVSYEIFRPAYTATGVPVSLLNTLTPNDHYSGRTAPLTSKRCILYIYSTNIGTAYFKNGIYSPFFPFKMQFVS